VHIFLIIVFLVIFVLVFVLKEKKSINKHKKNLNYTTKTTENKKVKEDE
jgi:preprotein translocase subunit YajC